MSKLWKVLSLPYILKAGFRITWQFGVNQFWLFLCCIGSCSFCDLSDICSEWWEDMTWPKKTIGKTIWRLATFETLITIPTVENLNLRQSLLPDSDSEHWTVFAILAIFCYMQTTLQCYLHLWWVYLLIHEFRVTLYGARAFMPGHALTRSCASPMCLCLALCVCQIKPTLNHPSEKAVQRLHISNFLCRSYY